MSYLQVFKDTSSFLGHQMKSYTQRFEPASMIFQFSSVATRPSEHKKKKGSQLDHRAVYLLSYFEVYVVLSPVYSSVFHIFCTGSLCAQHDLYVFSSPYWISLS